MTDRAAHETYKELSREVNELGKDMIKGLVALRAVSGENKATIRRLEDRLDRISASLVELGSRLDKFEVRVESDARHAKDRQVADRLVKAEGAKGRWMLWVAVVGGLFGLVSTIAKVVAGLLR